MSGEAMMYFTFFSFLLLGTNLASWREGYLKGKLDSYNEAINLLDRGDKNG